MLRGVHLPPRLCYTYIYMLVLWQLLFALLFVILWKPPPFQEVGDHLSTTGHLIEVPPSAVASHQHMPPVMICLFVGKKVPPVESASRVIRIEKMKRMN